jgi:hypothetical protein
MAIVKQLYLGFQPFHPQFADDPEAISYLAFSAGDEPQLEETFQCIVQKKHEKGVIIQPNSLSIAFSTLQNCSILVLSTSPP